jgi:hypothetical protein
MLTIYQGYAVSDRLLEEVARTQWAVDPVLFCYSVCAILTLLVCTIAYLVVGRHAQSGQHRIRRSARRHAAMHPRAQGAS